MSRSWIIGGRADCDLVLNFDTVSGRHCRLSQEDEGFLLEDLGSTNGTYVNGSRLRPQDPTRVQLNDDITLGLSIRMPWPKEAFASERTLALPSLVVRGESALIGRGADCDPRFELPMVSNSHARIERREGQLFIEDLNSANGTFVNGVRILGSTLVKTGDRIGLGSFVVVLAEEGQQTAEESADLAKDEQSVPTPFLEANDVEPEVTSPALMMVTPVVNDQQRRSLPQGFPSPARLLGLLALSPCLSLLFVVALQAGTGGSKDAMSPAAVAAALYWLGLLAIGLGLSNAVVGLRAGALERTEAAAGVWARVAPFLVFAGLAWFQCLLAFGIFWAGVGLKGSVVVMLLFLWTGAGIGFALGKILVTLAPRPSFAWCTIPFLLLALWALGGLPRPISRMGMVERRLAQVLPTRWTFEGLLLQEAERHSSGDQPNASHTEDLAEPYFSAKSERMGDRADGIALAAMLLGLGAASAFISEEVRRKP